MSYPGLSFVRPRANGVHPQPPPKLGAHRAWGDDSSSLFSISSSRTAYTSSDARETSYIPGGLSRNVDLRVSAANSAKFDCKDSHGDPITPRRVEELHLYSEQSGDSQEWVVLKVTDPARKVSVWLRFQPFKELGDHTYKFDLVKPPASASRAVLRFENGVEYREAVATWARFLSCPFGPPEPHNYADYASAYAENLSLFVNFGVGSCTPHDLCQIWPVLPCWDRRLQAFYWYEQMDDSGVEYLILQFLGASNLSNDQSWWVRLERDGANDSARFSRSKDALISSGSQSTRQVVFKAGVPFETVIEILRETPPGFSLLTEDCWYYASTIAYKLSEAVKDDYFDCSAEDLWEIWSGERGALMPVNRLQLFQDMTEEGLPYMIFNVSPKTGSRSGLWIRLRQGATDGNSSDSARVSRNRRTLLESGSAPLADATFAGLKFGQVPRQFKRVSLLLARMTPSDARAYSKPAMMARELTQIPNQHFAWVQGDLSQLGRFLPPEDLWCNYGNLR